MFEGGAQEFDDGLVSRPLSGFVAPAFENERAVLYRRRPFFDQPCLAEACFSGDGHNSEARMCFAPRFLQTRPLAIAPHKSRFG